MLIIPPDGAHLVTGPLYHNGPFVTSLLALLRGNHLVIMERFDATAALALIERDHVDWMYAEVYSEAARLYPRQVIRILIHDVTCQGPDDPRYQKDFNGLHRSLWQIFRNPSEIKDAIPPAGA